MRKLIYISLLFITNVAFGQVADVYRTKPVTNTGANFNKQSVHDSNVTFDFTLRIPRSTHFTLNGGKDTLGAIAYALDVHKMGVYRGSGVWDTLNNNSGTSITQAQVLHLADSLLSKLNVGDSTLYATQYYVSHNYVPYTGAKFNVNIGTHDFSNTGAVTVGGSGNVTTINSSNLNINSNTGFFNSVSINGTNSAFNIGDGAGTNYFTVNANGGTGGYIGENLTDPTTSPIGIYGYINNAGGRTLSRLSASTVDAFLNLQSNYITTNSNQTGLTGDKTSNAIWNTSGQWQANGGVTPDGMGAINNTMPGNSSNYAFYGMTRSGIAASAIGIDNLNAIIMGTGPTRGNGATIDTILFRLNSHTGDLMLYGKLSVPGTTVLSNYYSNSGTPTAVLGSSSVVGTGAMITVTGSNQHGEITLITGTGITATGSAFTITMNGFSYPTKCTPSLFNEVDLGASGPRMTVNSLTGTTWTVSAGGNNFTSSSTYIWTYNNGGY